MDNTPFQNNQVLSGGLVLMFVGGLLAAMRAVPAKLFKWLRDRLLITVEINNNDPSYPWVKAWLATKGKSRFMYGGIIPDATDNGMNQMPVAPRFFFCPAGVSVFRHNGKRVVGWINRSEVAQSKEYRESITLRCLTANRDFFQSILSDAHAMARGQDGTTVEVFVPDGAYWMFLGRKQARWADSIVLPDGMLEDILDDVRSFLANRQWYVDRGIPWRRSFLLYGPPGAGKSTLAHVLASELRKNLYTTTLSAYYSDDALYRSLARVPCGHVVLMEDIDKSQADAKGVSASALLNALDGMTAQDGRILIMTTNHIDKIDPAILRAGRIDRKIYIGEAVAEQIHRMFLRFFPGNHRFASVAAGQWEGESMAAIQEHLLRHRNDPETAAYRPNREEAEVLAA